LWLAVLTLSWPAVRTVVNLGVSDERYVQIIAAPVLFILLLYWERDDIFAGAAWSPRAGTALLSLSLLLYLVLLRRPSYGIGDVRLPLAVLWVVAAWMAAFILCFGPRSFRAACFPLCCLLLMVPVRTSLMDGLTSGLEHASAVTSCAMLRLAGVPVFAQGTRMLLPGVAIEVAPECSGIHSFLSLGLVALLASRVCLRSGWSRLVLVVATIPFAIFKNAMRISVIASLGAYVNRAFLHGRIHHYGGLVFTPLAIALLFALLVALQRSDAWIAETWIWRSSRTIRIGDTELGER
jgi:exosortase